MPFPKCERCERPATHKFTRMVDGHPADFCFCAEHAAEFSPQAQGKSQPKISAADLAQLKAMMADLLKSEQGGKPGEETAEGVENLKCVACGLAFREYRRSRLLGCSACYRAFEKPLQDDLRRYHGTVRHSAKALAGEPGISEEAALQTLQERLKVAIADEDFELAGKLRDEIRNAERRT